MQMFPDSDECETLLRNYVTFFDTLYLLCCIILQDIAKLLNVMLICRPVNM